MLKLAFHATFKSKSPQYAACLKTDPKHTTTKTNIVLLGKAEFLFCILIFSILIIFGKFLSILLMINVLRQIVYLQGEMFQK